MASEKRQEGTRTFNKESPANCSAGPDGDDVFRMTATIMVI